MNQINGKELYEMYHIPETKEKAILWAYDNSLNEIDMMTRKICNNVSKEELEDVRQALYEVLWNILDRYDYRRGAWSTWLSRNIRYPITETISKQRFGTSRHKMITYGLKPVVSLNTTVSWDEKENTEKMEFLSASVDIEHDYIKEEDKKAIRETLPACFACLPDLERTVMRYSMRCDGNLKEAVKVLGMSEKEVRSKVATALKKLKKMTKLQKLYQSLYGQNPDLSCGKHKRRNRTGEKINGKDGGIIVIAAYRGRKDIDAIWRIDNVYYLFEKAQYTQLFRHLSHACMMKHLRVIDADTEIHGKAAAAYF